MATKRKPKKILKKKAKVLAKAAPAFSISIEWFAFLLIAWGVAMAWLLSLPNYNQWLPADNPFQSLQSHWILYAAFAALVFLWRKVPDAPEDLGDFSKGTARVLFWLFMGLGAFLRLHRPEQPVGAFWDDHYIVISDIRNIIDYEDRPLLFPSGWREPLFPYFTAFLWTLLPHATGVFIDRLSSSLIDLAALWLFYLIGKEIGGRRMGILLLAMGAISKTFISTCKFGYGIDSTVLACALALLFFLRVLKKPDWVHFLEWGLALGFGALCYVPFRVWVPTMLMGILAWILYDRKERHLDFYRAVLGPGLMAAWIFLFFYKNSFLPEDNSFIGFLTGPFVLAPLALLLGFTYFQTWKKEKGRKEGFGKIFGWATAALVTALVMAPFYLHPHYSTHTADISVFGRKWVSSTAQGFSNFFANIAFGFGLMFGRVGDVAQFPYTGDSVFDFWVPTCAVLGLAYFIARPRWLSAFVAALFVASYVPFALSNAPHSFRLMACFLPLFLTGAWGVNRLWVAALQTGRRLAANLFCAVFFLAFGAWEMEKNWKILEAWMNHKGQNVGTIDLVDQELPDHRVYLVDHNPGFWTNAVDILADGRVVYKMGDSNAIDLTPGEKGKDLAILVYNADEPHKQLLEKTFPGIAWKTGLFNWDVPQGSPLASILEVPFDRVPSGDSGLFHTKTVPDGTWRRRCYNHYGLARGVILYEDRVVHWNDNPPPYNTIDWANSMKVEGDWNVRTEGDYSFKIRTGNELWFKVDGKELVRINAHHGGADKTAAMHLSTGIHHVELVTAFAYEHRVPTVSVTVPGSTAEVALDELAAATAAP